MNLNKIKKSFVHQHGQSDCGVACLSSIIKYHGGSKTLDELRRVSGTTKTGTSLLGLFQAGQKLGFDVVGLEAESINNLIELEQPAILHVTIENAFDHYVVFFGFQDDQIIIGDPSKGLEKWPKSKLVSVWQSKSLLKLEPNGNFEKKDKKTKKYENLIDWIKEDTNILLSSLFLGVIISIFTLSTAVFTQKLIDVILPSKDIQKLTIALVLFLFVLLTKNGLTFVRSKFLITQSRDFNNRMISSFIQSLVALPKSFFDSKKTGEMIARLNDTQRIQTTIRTLVGSLLIDGLIIVVSLVAVFSYSWQIGVVTTSFIPLYFLIIWRLNKSVINAQKEVMSAFALNEANYIDLITGMSEIKRTGSISLFNHSASSIYTFFQNKVFQLGGLQIRFAVLIELVGTLMIVSIISIGSFFVMQDELLLGSLMAILSLTGTIGPSLAKIAIFNINMQEAKVAFNRMTEFTKIKAENLNGKTLDSLKSIILKDVSFCYPGAMNLFHKINLTIETGKITALIGESGSGKSTVTQLIQGFYEPSAGEIFLDGQSMCDLSKENLRSRLSVVPQDIKIFNNNLLFNIALSDDVEVLNRVETWCIKQGFDTFFSNFPQGYNTLLGEEGANISGGQRQLVGVARALFRNPDMILLDESTSAMDRDTEKFILNLLQNLKKECGILIVSHRIQAALVADEIYVLENESVQSLGSPSEAISSNNLVSKTYTDLVNFNH